MSKYQMVEVSLAISLISGICGALLTNYLTTEQYKNYVKLEVTKTGTFFIHDERIYAVNELQTEVQLSGTVTRSH